MYVVDKLDFNCAGAQISTEAWCSREDSRARRNRSDPTSKIWRSSGMSGFFELCFCRQEKARILWPPITRRRFGSATKEPAAVTYSSVLLESYPRPF